MTMKHFFRKRRASEKPAPVDSLAAAMAAGRAQRSATAARRLAVGREADALMRRAADRLMLFRQLSADIALITTQLSRPDQPEHVGRDVDAVIADAFRVHFHDAAPRVFDIIPPGQRPFRTLEAASYRYTSEERTAPKETMFAPTPNFQQRGDAYTTSETPKAGVQRLDRDSVPAKTINAPSPVDRTLDRERAAYVRAAQERYDALVAARKQRQQEAS